MICSSRKLNNEIIVRNDNWRIASLLWYVGPRGRSADRPRKRLGFSIPEIGDRRSLFIIVPWNHILIFLSIRIDAGVWLLGQCRSYGCFILLLWFLAVSIFYWSLFGLISYYYFLRLWILVLKSICSWSHFQGKTLFLSWQHLMHTQTVKIVLLVIISLRASHILKSEACGFKWSSLCLLRDHRC